MAVECIVIAVFVTFVSAQRELSFLDLGPAPNVLDNVDDSYSRVSLPSQLYFGSTSYSTSYISSNGLVSFGVPYTVWVPKLFPIDIPVISPFWDDINLNGLGNMSYKIFTSTSSSNTIQQVNDFVSSKVNLTFNADWILVAQWLNVCPYLNPQCNGINPNTFQLVLAVQGKETYAVFTYRCDQLQWTRNKAAIGFSADDCFYKNHPLSKTDNVTDIDCNNLPISYWNNVIYQLNNAPPSSDKNVYNGTLVTLCCNVIEINIYNHFLWTYLRTGEVVYNESVYQFTSTVFTGGEYQCLAYNDNGNNQTDTTTVNVGPMIITNPSSINITFNVDNITLICEAMGIPIPTISWIYNGDIINNNIMNDISVKTIVVGLGIVRSVLTMTSMLVNYAGEYMCNATSQVTFYNSVSSDIATVVIHVLPLFNLNITTHGSSEVGKTFTLECTIKQSEGLPVLYNAMWEKNDDMLKSSSLVQSTTILSLTLSPVTFHHGGEYRCTIRYNTTSEHQLFHNYTLVVKIPPLSVDISTDNTGRLYAGTSLTIACLLNLTSIGSIDVPITVSNIWTRNSSLISTSARISKSIIKISSTLYNATLYFYPLDDSTDTGEYHCSLTVVPASLYIQNTSITANSTVMVRAISSPSVSITKSGTMSTGSSYTLICRASLIDRFIVLPEIVWTKETEDSSLVSNSGSSVRINGSDLQLVIESLNASDAGKYICTVTLRITEIDLTVSSNSSETIFLQIPNPILSIQISRLTAHVAGSPLNITCNIMPVVANIDIHTIVHVTWKKNDRTIVTSDRVLISELFIDSAKMFQSILIFKSLSITVDSANFTCHVFIQSNPSYLYVQDSMMVTDLTYLIVKDPSLTELTVVPESFIGLESSCPDSFPYHNLTLICSATIPALILDGVDFNVIWYHNDTIHQSSKVYENGQTSLKNILYIDKLVSSDSGTYQCVATIKPIDSPLVTFTNTSTAVIRPLNLPNPVTKITTITTTTTVNINFTVSSIAYTQETYHIVYTGLELQNTQSTSASITGSTDINDRDLQYNIVITGLEKANIYNFTVVASNCIGNTSSSVETFTMQPAPPSGPPLNCRATNISSHTVTLSWDMPVKASQNGDILSYNITCYNNDQVIASIKSIQMSISVPDLEPFTDYVCTIAAINVLGEGPTNNKCVFKTKEDDGWISGLIMDGLIVPEDSSISIHILSSSLLSSKYTQSSPSISDTNEFILPVFALYSVISVIVLLALVIVVIVFVILLLYKKQNRKKPIIDKNTIAYTKEMKEYEICGPPTLTGNEYQISTTEENIYECMDEATYENIGKYKASIDGFPSRYPKATNIYDPVYMNT